METNLEKRITATEDLLNYHKATGDLGLNKSDSMILENQLAIMKELKELRLDTKAIISNTAQI